uniref:Palmitoyltransferase n=1 Tax=Clastoptera arizonana TaxID=38151 RepID=A0A1B6DGU8_9HEMI
MATVQDRIRFPWKGGATQIPLDSLLPIFLLPLLGYIAAHGVWISVILFTTLPSFLIYIHYMFMRYNSPTKFFLIWTLMSIFLIFMIFEMAVVNLLDIRTDENFSFIIITIIMLGCGCKTKLNAEWSYLKTDSKMEMSTCDETPLVCSDCRKRVSSRSYHCNICHVCIVKRDLHCAWLNCCIGEKNHRWYLATLISALAQTSLCSNLILTTACHPFKVFGSFMLPDDCSDVYFDILYGVMFVTSVYCILVMIFLLILLINECWLISLGITGHEWRNSTRRSLCGLVSNRPYSKGFFSNWWEFFFRY